MQTIEEKLRVETVIALAATPGGPEAISAGGTDRHTVLEANRRMLLPPVDTKGFLFRTTGFSTHRMRPPSFLHLVGQILPRRRRRHPKARQQFESLLIQRLPDVFKVSHHWEPGLVVEAENQSPVLSLTACSFIDN
jgi:hypothetical protein